jgi:threonine/homoserine/homoserine lactone efflux protein
LIFGLTNPKAYPFALAMFTALVGRFGTSITVADAPSLVAMALVGFVAADVLVVAWTGLRPIRRLFESHEVVVTRATGAIFVNIWRQVDQRCRCKHASPHLSSCPTPTSACHRH